MRVTSIAGPSFSIPRRNLNLGERFGVFYISTKTPDRYNHVVHAQSVHLEPYCHAQSRLRPSRRSSIHDSRQLARWRMLGTGLGFRTDSGPACPTPRASSAHSKTPLIAACCVDGYRCRYRFDVASFMCPAHSCTSR
jgi:hypothetical protein